jgi:hypothetical protein
LKQLVPSQTARPYTVWLRHDSRLSADHRVPMPPPLAGSGVSLGKTYPRPIVDRKAGRDRAPLMPWCVMLERACANLQLQPANRLFSKNQ